MAKIAVIVGSVRSERYGIKVEKRIVIKPQNRGHQVFLVDPVELALPFLDKIFKEIESPSKKLQEFQKTIKDTDGYIPITPEYNHSVSSTLKNTLDFFRQIYLQII